MWGLVAIGISPATYLWHGWVCVRLWGWFIAPLGLPELGVAHAIGIGVFVSMFGRYQDDGKDLDGAWVAGYVLRAVFIPAYTLAAGAVVHAFM